jgi:amino acid transporter
VTSDSLPAAPESTALAKDRPGVVTTLYAVTGLSAIGAAFVAVALVLAVFAVGYVAMARHITNAGALYAYISRGLGRPAGVGAALALLAMVWSGLANYATLLGVPPGSTEAWALPAAFAVAAVIGIAYGVWLRSSRPSVYQAIGVGAGP